MEDEATRTREPLEPERKLWFVGSGVRVAAFGSLRAKNNLAMPRPGRGTCVTRAPRVRVRFLIHAGRSRDHGPAEPTQDASLLPIEP